MKNLKRVLSMALATVMVMGMMVVGSGAANTANEYGKAIATVKVLGVMEGDENGNFNEDKVVTRNEMAVVMSNLADLKLNGAHPFTDVPNWADKYVGALYTNGLTSGTSATTYGGSANITTTTAALMLMKTLGWFEFQGEFGEDWALATVKKAAELKLFEDIDAGVNEGLTRGELAQMIVNALDCAVVSVSETGGLTVEGNGLTVAQKPTYDSVALYNTLIEKLYDVDEVADLWDDGEKDLFGRPCVVVSYEDETIEVAEAADIVLVSDDTQDLVADLFDDEKLEFDNADDFEQEIKEGYVVELFVNEDDEDVLDEVVVYYYYAAEVESVEECDEDQDEDAIADGAELKFEIDGVDYYDIQLIGLDASELEEGDYVAVATKDGVNAIGEEKEIGENDYDVVYGWVKAEKVSGKASSVKGTEFVKIDGTKYLLAAGQAGLTAGNEYDLYTDANGFVIFAEETKDAAVIDDVYVVDAVWTVSDTDDYNKPVTTRKAQLIDMNGEVSIVTLEKGTANMAEDWAGKLVTLTDKKYTEGDTTYKANNDKFDLNEWTSDDYAEDWDVYTFDEALTFEADDTRVVIAGTTYRVNSKTNYMMIGDTEDDIVVTTKVGGINVTALDAEGYIICKDGEKTINTIIVIAAEEIEEDAQFSEDLIFIKSASTEVGDGYVMQTVYFADGSKKTLNIADDQDIERGFYEYTVNEDGYYEIEEADAIASGSYIWEDEAGVIVNAVIDDADALFEGLLTVGTIEDIDVSDAEFVDAHSKTSDGQYTKAIASLEAAIKLLDKETITSFKISMNVSEDGAVVIILTDAYVA